MLCLMKQNENFVRTGLLLIMLYVSLLHSAVQAQNDALSLTRQAIGANLTFFFYIFVSFSITINDDNNNYYGVLACFLWARYVN